MGRPRSFNETVVLERAMKVFWQNGYFHTSIEMLTTEMEINRRVTQQVTQMENDILAKLKEHLEWEGDISFNPDPYKEG